MRTSVKGVAYYVLYRHFPVNPQKISAEAALFTEAPLSCMEFEILSSEIEREVVIYRPSHLSLHLIILNYGALLKLNSVLKRYAALPAGLPLAIQLLYTQLLYTVLNFHAR